MAQDVAFHCSKDEIQREEMTDRWQRDHCLEKEEKCNQQIPYKECFKSNASNLFLQKTTTDTEDTVTIVFTHRHVLFFTEVETVHRTHRSFT